MSQKKVLLVDDDADILSLLKSHLEQKGVSVAVTTHPSMVLRLVRDDPPDLIVCDINMDEQGGGDVAANLASDPQAREIPFLFLSSLVTPRDVSPEGTVGGISMISKHSPLSEILGRISEVLDGQE